MEKRARCAVAISDVVDGQGAGRNGALASAAQRGPERHPVHGTVEVLWGTIAARRYERPHEGQARRLANGSWSRRAPGEQRATVAGSGALRDAGVVIL